MAEVHLRKYGVGPCIVNFSLFEVDGVDFRTDASPAAGDAKIMKDEGALTTTTRTFTDEGATYAISLTTTEVTAARVSLEIVDLTGTKAWLDRQIIIETYGSASAQHAFDLDRPALLPATIQAECTDALNAYDPPTNAEMEARTIVAANYFDPAADTVHLGASALADVQGEVTTALNTYDPPTTAEMNARTLAAADYFSPSADTVHLGASALANVQGEVTTALNTYDPPTTAEMNARTIPSADYFDPSADTIQVGATSKTGYTLAAGSLTSNSLAAGAINAAALSSTAGAKLADIGARRTLANIEASSDGDTLSLRSRYGATCKLTNKVALVGTTFTVYRSNDTTALGTQSATTTTTDQAVTALDTN